MFWRSIRRIDHRRDFGTRECPSCGLTVEANHNRCPVCGYEFPHRSRAAGILIVIIASVLLAAFIATLF